MYKKMDKIKIDVDIHVSCLFSILEVYKGLILRSFAVGKTNAFRRKLRKVYTCTK